MNAYPRLSFSVDFAARRRQTIDTNVVSAGCEPRRQRVSPAASAFPFEKSAVHVSMGLSRGIAAAFGGKPVRPVICAQCGQIGAGACCSKVAITSRTICP